MVATIDANERIIGLRGDPDHALTHGYACFKGLHAHEFHSSSQRLLRPQRKRADRSFEALETESALDAVASRLGAIIGQHGPGAVACFIGTSGFMNATAYAMTPQWMKAIGSPSIFSSMTIDQSAKLVTAGRLGSWEAGRQTFEDADVWMFVGTNPLVSLSSASGLPPYNGQINLKAAKARGLKLIVVDPRRTETAQFADLHLQPFPGQDAILMAGLIREILRHGWEDSTFCAAHVHGMDSLRAAVEPFSVERVARRAGVPAAEIRQAAALWASSPRRGCAGTGTGPCMSGASNLADHMVELLNVICGRFLRAGERIGNPGVIENRVRRRAQVTPPPRWWEQGHRSRIRGVGTLPGMFSMEMAAGILADEILRPGEGQIRALVVVGGNPALAVPDQKKIVGALRSLDLLVSIDPFMSATSRLSDYVFAPKMMYERADFPMIYGYTRRTPVPFVQYTHPIAAPPAGSDVVDDWYILWGLAKRLGRSIDFCGTRLDMAVPPTTEALCELLVRHGPIAFDELKQHVSGRQYALDRQYVEPADPAADTRFDVMPADVADDLAAQAAQLDVPALAPAASGAFLLTSRRMRDALNSLHGQSPSVRARLPENALFINPRDAAEFGGVDGDEVEVISDHGLIKARIKADAAVRPRVVQLAHCFGGLPDDPTDAQPGACTNLLISTDRDCEVINAMPRQSGIPVTVRPVSAGARKINNLV